MDKETRIKHMLHWCDQVAVKWKKNGTVKVKPKFFYNNRHCSTKGGFCYFCKPGRKKAYFCNSYVIAACHHGAGINDKNFRSDCKVYKGHGTGGMMRRDFNPAVKSGLFEVVKGISKKHPLFAKTAKDREILDEVLEPGDVLIIARTDNKKKIPRICHTAIWYGPGLITECAGDAGCCTRASKYITRGQGRCIVKVYRLKGPGSKETTKTKYKVVNAKGMNVRKKPSVRSKKIGHVSKGDILTCSKRSGRWGYFPELHGWVCIKGRHKVYLKKV